MAIGITVLFILAELLGPSRLFGPLSQYRIELILAVLAIVFTIPSLPRSRVLGSRMLLSIGGLAATAALSVALLGWIGGIFPLSYGLMPMVLGCILPAVNCRTKLHLQLIILALFCGCAFDVLMGYQAIHEGAPSVYVFEQGFGQGQTVSRIRGEQFIADPNDFAQIMVAITPLMFFFWRRGGRLLNFVFLVPSLGVLLFGIYLTHSRGGLLALLATAMYAARRKIGLVPAAIGGGIMFLGAMAIGMTGGREVSVESGADRIELWALGLRLIKAHPLFGVGLGNFEDYAPITAHNSVVICGAELGIVGLACWVALIFTTFRAGIALTRIPRASSDAIPELAAADGFLAHRVAHAGMSPAADAPWMQQRWSDPESRGMSGPIDVTNVPSHLLPGGFASPSPTMSDEDIRRCAQLVMYALVGFLTAGWFLSRALSVWLCILCGFMHALVQMGVANGIPEQRDRLSYVLRWSSIIAIGLLTIVSLIIRISPS